MKITVLTLFPEMFDDFQRTSIVGRALQAQVCDFETVNIRDYTVDKHRHVDDTPFGGGAGMILQCQPVLDALQAVRTEKSHVVMLAPFGQPLTQQKARQLAKEEHLVLLCGHYEGMDARIEASMDEFISIGDYVLSGGELPAMVVADACIRLQEGSLAEGSAEEESFEDGLLEYAQYTKPADYKGMKVPEVYTSGHHEKIEQARRKDALARTWKYRPDLLEKADLSPEDRAWLAQIQAEKSTKD